MYICNIMKKYYLEILTNKYADFKGRARRKEYWMYSLFQVLIGFSLYLISFIFFTNVLDYDNEKGLYSSLLLFALFLMLHFIQNIAIAVRRLHDTGKSGWWYLLSLIPYIGPFILFILLVLESSEEENQWGVNPKLID